MGGVATRQQQKQKRAFFHFFKENPKHSNIIYVLRKSVWQKCRHNEKGGCPSTQKKVTTNQEKKEGLSF